jgi:hypothetical protein
MVWDAIWNRGQFRAELYPEFARIEQQNFCEALDKCVFGRRDRFPGNDYKSKFSRS